MKKTNILFHGLLHALGVLAYIIIVVTIMSNNEKVFRGTPEFVIGTFMLTLFVVSACITSGLVLGRPIYMYLEGAKKPALALLAATIMWLFLILLCVAALMLIL